MKGYKGFSPGMICRGKQYAENTVYEENNLEICKSGMHFCKSPFEVWKYYPPCDENGNINDFAEVEALGKIEEQDDKYCTDKLKVGEKISLTDFVQLGVDHIIANVNNDKNNANDRSAATSTGDCSAATSTGDCSAATSTGNCSAATNTGYKSAATNTDDRSAATNTGDWSAATNTGNCSAATNTGYKSAATNTGDCSAATNTGYKSAATNTGDRSAATNTGDCSAATNTGNWSAATNTGNWSAATNTGYKSAANVQGAESIAMAIGFKSRAAGDLGCWIVLAEWDESAKHILCVKSHKVDGKVIEPNTYYTLKKGKFVKYKEDK